jgi:hypothetical protein
MNSIGLSPNEIRFQLSGNKTISVATPLPAIQRSVTINPTNVPGIVLNGSISSGDGLVFAEPTVQASSVIGLEIRNFPGAGIRISPFNSNERVNVLNCYVHNNGAGIVMDAGKFHTVSNDCVIESNSTDGISISQSVESANISNSSIQSNLHSGVRVAGPNHSIGACYVVSNGAAEGASDNFGGVVLGDFATFALATNCAVNNCTLAGNTPYGAKTAYSSHHSLSQNETYSNTTKGFGIFASPTTRPTLSHFVLDVVHNKVVLLAAATGTANTQVKLEFFVTFPTASDQGAIFCADTLVALNSSGQGAALISFGRDEVFQAAYVLPNPLSFTIDHEDRIVATADQTTGAPGTSEFSVPSNPTLTGDYNLDGSVDNVDYIIWRDNQNATNALYTQGDGDFDGTVEQDDYDIWRAHFGQTP